MLVSNVVKEEKLKEVQLKTLEFLKNVLSTSFGPMGSNSIIRKGNEFPMYTKDGHTILKNICFNKPIEDSIKEDIESETRKIALTTGDGTTSAVILSYYIFKGLLELEAKAEYAPSTIISTFKEVVGDIITSIRGNKQECTLDKIHDIALVASDNNEEIANAITSIYKEFGNEVYIDVSTSPSQESYIKTYDGMTLEAGFADSCFVNDAKTNLATIRNPRIYIFEDPIDTPEMSAFFQKIVTNNILSAINDRPDNASIIPTVIMTPKISRDMNSLMDALVVNLGQANPSVRPPLLVITNIYKSDEFMDIAKLTGAKTIKKYLDLKIQQRDVEAGLAPTLDTVCDGFYGNADLVESSSEKTKFINPKLMFNEDGSYSNIFANMLKYYEAELKKAIDEGENANTVGKLRHRVNSLKANMVDYFIGGISVADRDSAMHLAEDAVISCRSAARDGVGFGANFEGLRASTNIHKCYSGSNDLYDKIAYIIADAYFKITKDLYATVFNSDESMNIINESIDSNLSPMNLRTKKFDGKVLTSIESDSMILTVISKIITLMVTSKQFILADALHNVYYDEKDLK